MSALTPTGIMVVVLVALIVVAAVARRSKVWRDKKRVRADQEAALARYLDAAARARSTHAEQRRGSVTTPAGEWRPPSRPYSILGSGEAGRRVAPDARSQDDSWLTNPAHPASPMNPMHWDSGDSCSSSSYDSGSSYSGSSDSGGSCGGSD